MDRALSVFCMETIFVDWIKHNCKFLSVYIRNYAFLHLKNIELTFKNAMRYHPYKEGMWNIAEYVFLLFVCVGTSPTWGASGLWIHLGPSKCFWARSFTGTGITYELNRIILDLLVKFHVYKTNSIRGVKMDSEPHVARACGSRQPPAARTSRKYCVALVIRLGTTTARRTTIRCVTTLVRDWCRSI